jgi:esterase/lipase
MASCGHDFNGKVPERLLKMEGVMFICDKCEDKVKRINDKRVKEFHEKMEKKYAEKKANNISRFMTKEERQIEKRERQLYNYASKLHKNGDV